MRTRNFIEGARKALRIIGAGTLAANGVVMGANPVKTAIEAEMGLNRPVAIQELTEEIEPYIPKDSDTIKFVITLPNGDIDILRCQVGPVIEWGCVGYFGLEDNFVNSAYSSYDEQQLGLRKDGSFWEVWVIREDGQRRKLEIKNVKEVIPAEPVGLNYSASKENEIGNFQPNEPIGSIVELTDVDGNRLFCRYYPDIGPFVMIQDVMGNWVGSENWVDGLYISAQKGVPTVNTNCNTAVDGKRFVKAVVNGKAYAIPKGEGYKFAPTRLTGFRPKSIDRKRGFGGNRGR